MIHPILLAATLLAALPANAQIYTWTDEGGRVHYSDTPPASGEVNEIGSPQARPLAPPASPPPSAGSDTGTPDAAPSSPRTLAEREQAFRERRAAAAEAEATAAAEAARNEEMKRFCSAATHELAALRAGQRMVRFNARGEREFLDDGARTAEISRLEQQTAERCR